MSRGVGRVCSCQGFGQKLSGRLGVPIGREQKIDRRAGGVKSPVQVPPFAFHSHIGLLDSDAVFPATLAAIHPRVRLLQSADDILLMMCSSRHFSFLSCLQNSRKAKETVDFLETMKNRGLRWVVSGAPPYRGNPRDSVEHQELEPIDFGASLGPE
jgi:hypothetical protein